MKKGLLFLLALPLLIASCTKTVISNNNNTVSGRWVLSYAEKQTAFGTKTIYTGFEEGIFYFHDNGQAVYDDGYDYMQGNWNWSYHGGSRNRFSLYLYDNYSGRTANWNFDQSWFNGRNQFTAVYSTYEADYYYVFERF